jgi:serine/threonine-protein kinase HipA
MLFDIAISNHDDHLRNHGFLLHNNEWELSPAFDINPEADEQFLEMNIDIDSGYRSFEKVIDTCEFYHISKAEAEREIRKVTEVIAGSWQNIAKKNGIKESERKYMSSAFALAEEANRKYNTISVTMNPPTLAENIRNEETIK